MFEVPIFQIGFYRGLKWSTGEPCDRKGVADTERLVASFTTFFAFGVGGFCEDESNRLPAPDRPGPTAGGAFCNASPSTSPARARATRQRRHGR